MFGLLLGTLAALLLYAPAHWLAANLARASGGHILLVQTRGTVWNGSAQLVLRGGGDSRDQAALPGRLHWQLRPTSLGLKATLTADCCTPAPLHLRVAIGWKRLHLNIADGESHWPAAVLGGLGTPWNTVQPQGHLVLTTRKVTLEWPAFTHLRLHGQLQLNAMEISSRLSTLRPMGSYRLLVDGNDATPMLHLSTLQGALQISGTGQWIGQRLRFNGEARATPQHEAALANLLNIIGRRSGARSIITLG